MKNRNIFKFLPVILAASLFFDSCKREVPGCTNIFSDNYNSSATVDDGSCYKYGCTDPEAENYDPKATQNAECVYLWQQLQGNWQTSDTYTAYGCTGGSKNYICTVSKGDGNRQIKISNFAGMGTEAVLTCNITTSLYIQIPDQSISGIMAGTWTVTVSYGVLNLEKTGMSISYRIEKSGCTLYGSASLTKM